VATCQTTGIPPLWEDTALKRLRVAMALLVGGTFIGASGTRAEQQQSGAPGCAKVVAVLDQHGGLSAEEIAKKTSSDVETVRSCTDTWRRGMKGGVSP
jgi:hypothetical protein